MSLLFFSFVFALPGLTGGSDAPAASAAVVVESQSLAARPGRDARARAGSTAVVISAPERARRAARPAARKASVARREAPAGKPSFNPDLRDLGPADPAPADATPTTSKPGIGKRVDALGEAVTATVQGAGHATAPLLGPPVSQVVQDLLDLLSSVLRGTTDALGGVLDKTVPR